MGKTQELWSCTEGILQCLILGVLWSVVSGQIHYSIPEEMQKGSFVGNIAKDLGMDEKHVSERGLQLVTRTGTIQYFAFNFNTGHLQISERIDREVICEEAETCIISFQVIIESKLEIYRVEVEITDVNDNAPRFASGKMKLKISEASTPGSWFPLPEAQDPDLGMNSIQNYQIRGSSHFSLYVQIEENGASHVKLVLEKSLDREEQSVYDLILTATDGGDPVRSGTAEIQVIVLDANDNAPVFTQPVYKVSVKENIPKGSPVITVKATDLDQGVNGEIKYSFKKIKEKDSKIFLLNSTTGTITLIGNLDYEESSSYEFEVKAEDGGGLNDLTKVIVTVIDLNDNAPELKTNFFINTIHENSPTGTVIALLNVQDRDTGINGEVTCSIPNKLPFQLKKSVDNFYSLVTLSDLDREQMATYNITIIASDHGTPPLSASTLLSLHILDTNDNPPVFAESVYTFHVPENNPRGTSIFSLEAKDPDWAENCRLSYSIIEGQVRNSLLSSYVSINSETGVVYALSPFDYEEFQEIRFQVKAQDGGSPPLSSNVSVTLFILDQNDNAPVVLYPSPPTDGSTGVELAPRSSKPGYLVTKVVAVDADSGQNGWLSYQQMKATEPGLFTVGLHTGEIRTTRFFLEKDALKQSLVILVKDNGQPPLSASVTITVVLADSIPDILTDLSNIAVSVDSQSDLTFYLVIAVAFVSCLFFAFLLVLLVLRLRKWRNSQLCDSGSVNFHGVPASQFVGIDGVRAFLRSYCQEVSLTSGSRKSQIFFPVGSCTDTLTPQQAPDNPNPLLILGDSNTMKEGVETYQGMEKAQKLWSCKDGILQCLILGLLWNVVSGQIHYSIPEEMQKGSFVGNIAKDLRMDEKHVSERGLRLTTRTGTIQYFALNLDSGHLQTSERIDREEICARAERCIISFQVIVESKLEIYRVEVEITDINDNAPRFASGKMKLKISEASTPGIQFSLPKAKDPDLGMNSIQSYQLRGSSHFSLVVQTGENGARHAELVLEKSLDREEQSVYDLILTATDGGDPVRSGSTEIQVIVLDANDNAPVFTQPVYKVSVKENIPKGSTVSTVKATDLDEGLNGDIKYSFEKTTENDATVFLLNSTTGTITLIGKLDYEESSLYEFEVKAEDGGGLNDLTKVIVSIIDLNDNAPEITISFFINTIHENSPTGTVIALLNVHDQDSGINGEVTCSIPDKLPFQFKKSIDNFYSLVTHNDLDREHVAAYNITITATDHGTPPLSASTLLSLHILDTNDNPPVFAESVYSFYIPENNPRGASIFSLEAKDPDWAENSRLSYSIIEGQVRNSLLSSYVSINSETGVVYALSPFDYEEFQEIRFQVKAQDGGSPPLSSSVSVTLFILDRNDNAPEILYPSPPTDGSTGVELAPHSSEPGYLVTKVVAVDADSGQNGWLSYQLIKATEPGLFTVGLHTGEIRTTRFFLEKDALKQSLVVLVKDNGQPPLSASVTVTVVLADSIPDILTDLSNTAVSVDPQLDLTFYLVIAVAFVSCLFFAFLLVLLVLRLRKWRNSQLCDSGSVNFHGVPASQFVGIDGVRAFLRSYCQEVSLTSGSRKSQIFFPVGSCTNTLTPQQAPDNTNPLLILGESNTNKEDAVTNQDLLEGLVKILPA
ncbi:uncharacterized protein [Tiliqua scincoides]|uniref:uncharacterized protein n=1 Tax=Tiliqua scincoides TaxID=71010 RepID=UPI003461B564